MVIISIPLFFFGLVGLGWGVFSVGIASEYSSSHLIYVPPHTRTPY